MLKLLKPRDLDQVKYSLKRWHYGYCTEQAAEEVHHDLAIDRLGDVVYFTLAIDLKLYENIHR